MFYFPDFFRSLNKIIQTCCFFCTGGGVGITDGEIIQTRCLFCTGGGVGITDVGEIMG
jgi:hypothetical protein